MAKSYSTIATKSGKVGKVTPAKRPKPKGRPARGWVDLEFLRSDGRRVKSVHDALHPALEGYVVETENPSPSSGKGGLVVFIPGGRMGLLLAEKYGHSLKEAARKIMEEGKELHYLPQAMWPAGGMKHSGWSGKALDAGSGCLVYIPYIKVTNLTENMQSWEGVAKPYRLPKVLQPTLPDNKRAKGKVSVSNLKKAMADWWGWVEEKDYSTIVTIPGVLKSHLLANINKARGPKPRGGVPVGTGGEQ